MRCKWLYPIVLLSCPLAAVAQSGWEDITPSASFVEPTFEAINAGAEGRLVARNGHVLYVSADGGDTWDPLPAFDVFEVESVDHAAVGPDGTVYASYQRRLSTVGEGVYRLAPGSETWTFANGALPDSRPRAFAVHPDTGTLFIGLNNSQFYRSTDQGATWTLVTTGVAARVLSFDFAEDGAIYIPQLNRAYRSEDDGVTWEQDGFAAPTGVGIDQVVVADDGMLYAYDYDDLFARDMDEDNQAWQTLALPADRPSPDGIASLATAGSTLLVDYSRDGLFRLNPDATWSRMTDDLPTDDATTLAADDAGNAYFSIESGGIYRTSQTDTEAELLPVDQVAPSFPALAEASDGRLFASAGWGGLYRSEDGATWTVLPFDPVESGPIMHLLAADDVLLAGSPTGVYRSTDAGVTWALVSGLPEQNPGHLAGSEVLFASFAYAGVGGLFRSLDAGVTWTPVPEPGGSGTALAVGWDGTAFTLASGDFGDVPYRSLDGGTTWTPSADGIDLDLDDYAESITRGRTDEFFLEVDGGTPWYRTTDNGVTWSSSGLSPPLWATPSLLFYLSGFPEDGYEIQRVSNEGEAPIGAGLLPSSPSAPGYPSIAPALDQEGRFYAGLAHGLYRTTGNATPSEPGADTPVALTLDAPYPNPTRGPVTFAFTLATPGHAHLTLYDVLGRVVARPLDSERSATRHSLTWDAAALPSGTYVAELRTASGVVRHSFTLLR